MLSFSLAGMLGSVWGKAVPLLVFSFLVKLWGGCDFAYAAHLTRWRERMTRDRGRQRQEERSMMALASSLGGSPCSYSK